MKCWLLLLLVEVAIVVLPSGYGWSGINSTEPEDKKYLDTTLNPTISEAELQTLPNIETDNKRRETAVNSITRKDEVHTRPPTKQSVDEIVSCNKTINELFERLVLTEDIDRSLKFPGNCECVKNLVLRMLREGNNRIMNFAYSFKNVWGDENIKKCFPRAFHSILSGKRARILTKDKTGVLTLSTNRDGWQDRWLRTESADMHGTNRNVMWYFRESQFKSITDNLYLEIRNVHYGMNIKLDVNMQNETGGRLAWGDERPYDERYKWKIVPAGLDRNDEPLFCFVDKVYKNTLKPASASYNYYQTENNISGFKKPCDIDMAWIIETEE